MGEMYNRIVALCNERGIKPGRVCADTGLSRGMMSDLKMGRTKELSAKNTKIIADYFGVTTDYLLTGEKTKKAPTQEGEREITLDDFTYAMQNEYKNLTDADKQILLSMAKQLDDARKKKNGESE